MYVILVNKDNTLIATQTQRIMQRSKLVDTLWFLVPPDYNEHDMANFTVLLEYVLPISRKYRTEILTLSEETYNGHLIYRLPFDTTLTDEHGEIELYLSFISVELNESGNATQHVRKTSSATINVIPISAWSDIIPDSALTALDQRIIKMDAQIKALNETNEIISQNKADNIAYNRDTNEFQLTAEGKPIGDKVILKSGETDPDGTIIVDFSNYAGDYDDEEEDDSNASAVVEF